ncbi:undecaprenyl-diphosphate phosphatase [Inmirania thermothiophila]|uniref:Undecaprenyl-diphosphatase n=1 Tax=Inmirania thermothiophila TaxID=1750597 RepID=A0A3N1Y6U0_9GAMM|nr:undecaprenyl-diphosphate phosphatase [Inmirania thermothiophila]ROR34523.1 undecaprenyl-diphosphatase [Inmirania thermothiophila]
MEPLQVAVLALLQGFTEFLPISSSAHLILVPVLTGWPDQGLAFDVAVHVGTLAAVLAYFRDRLRPLLAGWWSSLRGEGLTAEGRLAWAVILGTVPVGLAGLVFGDLVETRLRSPLVIALATVGFGLLLGWADRRGGGARDEGRLTWRDVAVVGCAQALALVPGTSRSGITITAGLALGLSREAAARYSFLLSIPVIVLAGGLKTLELAQSGDPVPWGALLAGAGLSAASAYLCIRIFMAWIERAGMMPFVLYRLALGGVLLAVFA